MNYILLNMKVNKLNVSEEKQFGLQYIYIYIYKNLFNSLVSGVNIIDKL